MLVTIEPEFDVYCKENYQLEDDINKVTDDDNDGYFSGDDLPLDEMNEVSDEWFEDHLMDGVTPAKSANHSNKKDKKEPTKNDVSAYEAVYGQVLDHPLCCTKAEARRCWTVKDRMLVTIEPEFDIY
jgi:hypothetical protein